MTLMPVWTEQIKYLVGMFAILNPLGAIPIYLSMMTDRRPEVMHRTAFKASVAVAVILILAAWSGDSLLSFFGIGMPAFRIAGGLLVLLIAVAMFGAKTSPAQHTDAEQAEGEAKNDIAVVPLAIPLLAGPGAITHVIVASGAARGDVLHQASLLIPVALVALSVWLAFRAAPTVARRLGKTGIHVVTRLMGLIIAAISVQMIADGLGKLFPGWLA